MTIELNRINFNWFHNTALTLSLVNLGFAVLSSTAARCSHAKERTFLEVIKVKLGLHVNFWLL